MNKAFTLIELMIVIAIIAIIAAIAIPNLLESRITANEAAAATSLKSGIFPAQTQFQAGSYIDQDSDGRGTFACHVASMAGGTGTGLDTGTGPFKALSLLDPKFANQQGNANHMAAAFTGGLSGAAAAANAARAGAFDYYTFVDQQSTSSIDNAESFWGGAAIPGKTDGSEARRCFGINAAGTIYQSKQTVSNADAADVTKMGVTSANALPGTTGLFGNLPTANVASVGSLAAPYQK